MKLKQLIWEIAQFRANNVFNPWAETDPLDVAAGYLDRQGRLERHFTCEPRFLLVGEAPGYQGCHFSGVPFTNEALIYAGIIPRLSPENRFTTRDKPWSEPSATIVWRTLAELGIADKTVLWNAFAWHPYKPGEPMSNRALSKAELEAGRDILGAVCERFKGARLVAVGRVAERTLKYLGFTPDGAVRHPSMGGATKF